MYDSEEPFIRATQAKKIFHIVDPSNKKWYIVVPGKRCILGIGDVDDKDEDDVDVGYTSVDHTRNRFELSDSQGMKYLCFFGTYSLKLVQTWFVWHETCT